ncbi:ABC transporter permease [Pedobacter flavus]|uniref:FtsX-like permease family protein n=1 Tax=Pedobacter flavus TaxID=3113906 RepID=A0ABU7H3J8_9SPHI|nr:FtsX-like permease family protein [Pedobacter sp. VNH31]MEE1885907.1 FtsX-like permease family protein [Pedobacter sp. VNH31]
MKKRLNLPWLFKMAWRDSRRNRSKLMLFISSIILGISALVAIYTFGVNLNKDIDQQAATLLGADLEIAGNKKPTEKVQQLIDSIGGERSEEQNFPSMAMFMSNGGTRLVQVRALSGNFPYYGSIETIPAAAGISFRNAQDALVDKSLLLQFNTKVGDSIKIGDITFKIAGSITKAPGQTGFAASVAPVVYIPLAYLEATGLVKVGSRINYKYYFKLKESVNVEALAKAIDGTLDKDDFRYETIASQKEDTGRSFANLTNFLSLVGFIALLLGCIGVASAIHIYIREKLASIAVLRCLGTTSKQAFIIFLIQITGIGFIGSLIGAGLGTLIQQLLPVVFKDFLPIEISSEISYLSIFQGISVGVLISILFALLPLVNIRKVSPLNTLRNVADLDQNKFDWVAFWIYTLIVVFIYTFTWIQIGSALQALIFTIGIFIAFLLLFAMAKLLMFLTKKLIPSKWGYLWRQGFANLYRPNNQTIILIISVGLGTLFISLLFLIQSTLLSRIQLSSSSNQPNMVLFDIQTAQKEEVAKLVKEEGFPVIQEVPIVTLKLDEINGKTQAELKNDSTNKIPRRTFSREFRVTYRSELTDAESIRSGKWVGEASGDGPIPISIEGDYAKSLSLKLGDELLFNVQGVPMLTKITSFRNVEWGRIQTNFLVVFPKNSLENAPQFHVLLTKTEVGKDAAQLQTKVVSKFPNISIVDLGLVLLVLDDILDKIGFIVQFMGGFSIATGLVVLVASVMISKYQRIKESVLLRTLGASRKQILMITGLEYFFLGSLAAASGIILSLIGGWALAVYSFKAPFIIDWISILSLFGIVTALTILIGLFNSRGIISKPPLEILRGNY